MESYRDAVACVPMSPAAPSTSWRENVAPDESTRYERYAQQLHELQEARKVAASKADDLAVEFRRRAA